MKIDKFQLSMIRGAIAKSFVVKHYRGGKVVVTKYPDMKNIVASEKQKVSRRLFRKAVKYAQKVFSNPALKEEKRRVLRRPRRLFQALMKEWFQLRKEREWRAERRIERWRRKVRENESGCNSERVRENDASSYTLPGVFAKHILLQRAIE